MYKINVLMSTYNGEKYIGEQIDSIMSQKDVDVLLTIRDDGSSDGTVDIIKSYIRRYGDRIRLYTGHNVGYKKSFRRLLKYAAPGMLYAFSDQDDVWMEDKLINAVRLIEDKGSIDKVCLYASGDILTDEKLNRIKLHDVSDMIGSIQSYYSRARLAGCTYVFTEPCLELGKRFADARFPRLAEPDHDFIIGSIALSCGDLIIDDNAYIYHRRMQDSVTSGGNGVLQRLKVEYNLVFGQKGMNYCMAETSLRLCADELKDDARYFFGKISGYKSSLKNKLGLMFDKQLRSGIFLGDMETKLKILLDIY